MQYYLTTLGHNSEVPLWLHHTVFDHFAPTAQESALCESSAVFVVIQCQDSFRFDPEIFRAVEQSKLPIVIFDYSEGCLAAAEYERLKTALASANVVGWFLRDYKVSDHFTGCPVWPLEFTTRRFTAYDKPEPLEVYKRRPIDLLLMWGYSSIDRVRLHGALMTQFSRFRAGTAPAQTLEDAEWAISHDGCSMALIYTPHYRRMPLDKMMWLQSQAKITISLFGNGMKCFRSTEAGYNSVGAHQAPESLLWAYPWIDQHNCIALPNLAGTRSLDIDAAVEALYYWSVVDHGALYTLYEHSHENNQKYVADVYARDYILPKIREVCAS